MLLSGIHGCDAAAARLADLIVVELGLTLLKGSEMERRAHELRGQSWTAVLRPRRGLGGRMDRNELEDVG